MNRRALLGIFSAFAATALYSGENAGPKPPKTDLPYLLEAGKLIPADAKAATRSSAKDGPNVSVDGATSSARTPLPEPVFLFSPGQISADSFELIRFQVANGRRQWTKGNRANPNSEEPDEPLRLTLRPAGEGIIRIEAAEMLNPGEYALIPRAQNTAFCFTVF